MPSTYEDSLDYEKMASGHDERAALNESLAHATHIPEGERALHAEISACHGSLAAKYRALAKQIRDAKR